MPSALYKHQGFDSPNHQSKPKRCLGDSHVPAHCSLASIHLLVIGEAGARKKRRNHFSVSAPSWALKPGSEIWASLVWCLVS